MAPSPGRGADGERHRVLVMRAVGSTYEQIASVDNVRLIRSSNRSMRNPAQMLKNSEKKFRDMGRVTLKAASRGKGHWQQWL
jgi:hypothetical protein